MATLTEIASYITENHRSHNNFHTVNRVFELLLYIKKNLSAIAELAGEKQLFRHPDNHMAVHLHGNSKEVECQLRNVIAQVEQCFSDFFLIKSLKIKSHVIDGFLNNIEDSDVGCMEVRLNKAFSFYGLYRSRGEIFSLNDLMGAFFSGKDVVINDGIALRLLDFFSDSVTHETPVSHNNCIQPLTWDLIKTYFKEVLYVDNIDALWARYYQDAFASSDAVIVPTRYWHHYNFNDESSAIQHLNYIRSIIGREGLPGFNKAEVRYDDANQVYTFRLSNEQHATFNKKVKHLLRGQESDSPMSQLPGGSSSNVSAEDANADSAPDDLFYCPPPFDAGVDIFYQPNGDFAIVFKESALAIAMLNSIKALISQDYPEVSDVKAQASQKFPDKYYFELSKAQLDAYRRKLRKEAHAIRPDGDFFIKSLRSDEYSYVRSFIKHIFPPNATHQLRKGQKRKYTVTGKGVFARSEKYQNKSAPLKVPQYTKEQKAGYSNFQATSMGTSEFSPRVFGFKKDRPLVGVIFGPNNVLPSNRLFIYDYGTVGRPYDFESLEEAQAYNLNKVNRILFSADSLDSFRLTIKKNENLYNEALVRVKGTADDGLRVFVSTDNLESRLIAQEYARLIKKHLYQNELCAPDYQVQIIYYTPDNESLHFKPYTLEEQLLDYLDARLILNDNSKLQAQLNQKNFSSLFALTGDEVLKHLIDSSRVPAIKPVGFFGYMQVYKSLLDRVDMQALPSQKIKALLEIRDNNGDTALIWAAEHGHSECIKAMLEKLDASQIKALLEIKDNNGDTALIWAAKNGHSECIKAMLEKLDASQIKYSLIIEKIKDYIETIKEENDKISNTSIFLSPMIFFKNKIGYSKSYKLEAANAFLNAIEKQEKINDKYLGALDNGRLGEIFNEYKYVKLNHKNMIVSQRR